MYNRQAILPVDYQMLFLESITDEIEQRMGKLPIEVQIWYHAYCMVKEPASKAFYFRLKNSLIEKLELLNEEDGLALFLFLQNSLHKAIDQQNPIYFQELFELYEIQIRQGWLLSQNGTMLPNVFKNIVTVGITLDKLNWTKDFIEKFQDYLEEESKEDMLAYAWGLLAFKEQKYSDALRSISVISQRNIFLSLSYRRLQLMIYFEQQDWEALFAAINSFRVFLHRLKRLSERHKSVNINFLNFLNTLAKLSQKPTPASRLEKLRLEIASEAQLPERNWLLDKTAAAFS